MKTAHDELIATPVAWADPTRWPAEPAACSATEQPGWSPLVLKYPPIDPAEVGVHLAMPQAGAQG